MTEQNKERIAILGLGYVGLPLAVAFSRHFSVLGFDINVNRVSQLQAGSDATGEVDADTLISCQKDKSLMLSSNSADLADASIYIVTVPTPIDRYKRPDLSLLEKASAAIGPYLKKDNIVIFESTVYPGATEEICVPVLESTSKLVFNQDFFVGYSPERINPGDKERGVEDIIKVTSGSTPAIADKIDDMYRQVVTAGTFKASSIRVAEAAKVIENTQRDLNIALVNELALIFERLGIDTSEVLAAAGTKWNFLPFRPGLVGGHCIGVDPYYLTHKAKEIGYRPEVILAGRRINDNMGQYAADCVIKKMVLKGINVLESNILILGLAFKENCPDVRNTRVVDIVDHLKSWGASVDVCDPWVDPQQANEEYEIETLGQLPDVKQYDAVVLAVAHRQFHAMTEADLGRLCKETSVVYDVKSVWPVEWVDARL